MRSSFVLLRRPPQHPLHHLIPPGHRMSRHPGASGDGPVAGHIGVEFHVHPDLLLCLGELARRRNASRLIDQGLPFRLHLLNERIQFLLTLHPGLRVDVLRMARTVRPGGGVAPLKQVVIDLRDAPGAGLPGLSQHRLEIFD